MNDKMLIKGQDPKQVCTTQNGNQIQPLAGTRKTERREFLTKTKKPQPPASLEQIAA
jgi:hypothetical protein